MNRDQLQEDLILDEGIGVLGVVALMGSAAGVVLDKLWKGWQ